MNDRFKFRVFGLCCNSKLEKNWVNITEVGKFFIDKEGKLIDESAYFDPINHPEHFILEQCTGLKDKNGNLIYEGDIVYDSVYENNFVVSWDNDRTGYILSADNTNHIDYLSKILIERHNLKIIGNTHEQAEQKDK